LFTDADVFVFTMGLTEGWRSKLDGAVFPIAPGVTAGEFDARIHEFVNFNVLETERDMIEFLELLRSVNDRIKVLLTVSPVPLIATYENKHVLVATTYSKAVLRVVAETISNRYDWVDYFPSYEIITGSYNSGAYFHDDCREVRETGVAHAMRCFMSHYLADAPTMNGSPRASAPREAAERTGDVIVCDEEAIDQVRV
jgi:hypothetical protein